MYLSWPEEQQMRLALSNDTEKVVRLAFDANKFDENEVKANITKGRPLLFYDCDFGRIPSKLYKILQDFPKSGVFLCTKSADVNVSHLPFYDKIMTFNFLETREMINDQICRILLKNMHPGRFKKLISFEIELVAEEGQRIEIISEIFRKLTTPKYDILENAQQNEFMHLRNLQLALDNVDSIIQSRRDTISSIKMVEQDSVNSLTYFHYWMNRLMTLNRLYHFSTKLLVRIKFAIKLFRETKKGVNNHA